MKSYQTIDEENSSSGAFESVPEFVGRTNTKAYLSAAVGFALVLCATLASGSSPVLAAGSLLEVSPAQLAQQGVLTAQIADLKAQLNVAQSSLGVTTGVATTANVAMPATTANVAMPATTANIAMPNDTVPADLSVLQYTLIYNFLSLVTAAMGSSTIFFFFQFTVISKDFKNALLVSSMVTLIACYHYFRIFGSFTECYFAMDGVIYATGIPFNDAYRYVDWLLTVPLLLMELILVMQLDPEETAKECLKLGSLAALMVILGYPGEITDNLSTRWLFWGLAMLPFLVIIYCLFVGLQASVEKQPSQARGLVNASRYITVLSWCTYPVVYIFPMIGFTGASAQTAIQVGYSIADLVAKPVLGVVVWRIAVAKSE